MTSLHCWNMRKNFQGTTCCKYEIDWRTMSSQKPQERSVADFLLPFTRYMNSVVHLVMVRVSPAASSRGFLRSGKGIYEVVFNCLDPGILRSLRVLHVMRLVCKQLHVCYAMLRNYYVSVLFKFSKMLSDIHVCKVSCR